MMVRPGPGVYIINVKHKETPCIFASKTTHQLAKSNQINYQIRFPKFTSYQINLIRISKFDAGVWLTAKTLTTKLDKFSAPPYLKFQVDLRRVRVDPARVLQQEHREPGFPPSTAATYDTVALDSKLLLALQGVSGRVSSSLFKVFSALSAT